MNYADIKFPDVANGIGVRVSLFVSGCTHHCKGCFNSEAWDFNYGTKFDNDAKNKIFNLFENNQYIDGITILGGEPMEVQNQLFLYPFLKEFKEKFPNKTIWIYSGYTYEELCGWCSNDILDRCYCEYTDKITSMIDVLVDGEFVDQLKDIRLGFRGSSNQRVIDMKKTIDHGCRNSKLTLFCE